MEDRSISNICKDCHVHGIICISVNVSILFICVSFVWNKLNRCLMRGRQSSRGINEWITYKVAYISILHIFLLLINKLPSYILFNILVLISSISILQALPINQYFNPNLPYYFHYLFLNHLIYFFLILPDPYIFHIFLPRLFI
jgi:hypothetical protein